MIWLIGNRGMLGSDVERLLKKAGYDYFSSDREVDIADYRTLERYAGHRRADWIINCAAYTAVDRAEEEPDTAFRINADGPENLARLTESSGARLIHLSTDYVFDGRKKGPYNENDEPNPLGVYGKSKLEGENRIRSRTERHFILRTAWLYGSKGNNFVNTMLRLFHERDVVRVVDDQWGSPTFSEDLAGALLRIVESRSDRYGIYHYTNEGKASWYGFACEIHAAARASGVLERDCTLVPIRTVEYPVRAVRPKNSCLSKERIRAVFGIKVRDWKKALCEFITRMEGSGS